MSSFNESPWYHLPEDIIWATSCARTKPPYQIQTRCSSLRQAPVLLVSSSSQHSTAVFSPGLTKTDVFRWRYWLTGIPSMVKRESSLQCYLQAMLNVIVGITHPVISWISPMTTPTKLKALKTSRISKRKLCLRWLQVFRFQWHSIAPHFDVCKETNTPIEQNGYGCTLNSIKLVRGT